MSQGQKEKKDHADILPVPDPAGPEAAGSRKDRPGLHLCHTLTVGIRDSDTGDGRLVRHKWAGLDSDLPAAGKRYPRNDNIRFKLPSKNLAQGDLVLRVKNERGNSS